MLCSESLTHRSAVLHEVSLSDAGLNVNDYLDQYGELIGMNGRDRFTHEIGERSDRETGDEPNTEGESTWRQSRDQQLKAMWAKLVKQVPTASLHRGDILHIEEMSDYRNTGKFIFNGVKVEELGEDPEIDDYGYVPPTYVVGDEFFADHWLGTVDHNSYVWIDLAKYGDQLRATYDAEKRTSVFDGELGRFTVIFTSHIDDPDKLALSGPQFFERLGKEPVPYFTVMSVDTMYSEDEYSDPRTLFYVYDCPRSQWGL